jgi:hypothetical protein
MSSSNCLHLLPRLLVIYFLRQHQGNIRTCFEELRTIKRTRNTSCSGRHSNWHLPRIRARREVSVLVGYNSASRSNHFTRFRDDVLTSLSRMYLMREDMGCVRFECCPSFYMPRDRVFLQSVERCNKILPTKSSKSVFKVSIREKSSGIHGHLCCWRSLKFTEFWDGWCYIVSRNRDLLELCHTLAYYWDS